MSHPIHQANENSPYGIFTREEFYKKHHILHQQKFMLNKQNMKIFTQQLRPYDPKSIRGFVAMVHGYSTESSWLFELTAVAIAKNGFLVCALDLQGHGYSDGYPGHIPNAQAIVRDCIQFFDSVRANNSKLPCFLYGESLGGAIAILITLKQRNEWNGLILNGAMCGVSKKIKPAWPLQKLLPVAAFVAPKWRIVITKPPASKSYKEEWKRKLVGKSPNRHLLSTGKPPAATALEFLRVCKYIKRHCHELEVPILMIHGGDDRVCDPKSAKKVYEAAGSKDKSLKIFDGMGHMLIGEPNESVEQKDKEKSGGHGQILRPEVTRLHFPPTETPYYKTQSTLFSFLLEMAVERNRYLELMILIFLPLFAIISVSEARELRPAEHGLTFQNDPEPTGEMLSFFGGNRTAVKVPLPEAKNISDPASWSSGGSDRNDVGGGGDHVKKVWLVVISLLCGVTGGVLLVMIVFLLLSRSKKHESTSPPPKLLLPPPSATTTT